MSGVFDFTDDDRYAYSIFATCADLHGFVTGSGSGLYGEEIELRRSWLAWRLRTWARGPKLSLYEETVCALINVALDELAEYLKGLQP